MISRVLFRLKQILHWCGDDFDGCIVFDECHKAKNLCPTGAGKPTKTGQTVLELQNKLPKARVVYASATGKISDTMEQCFGSGSGFGSGLNQVSESGSGSRRAKMTHKRRIKLRTLMF